MENKKTKDTKTKTATSKNVDNNTMIFKMRKRWKILLTVSLILNILFIGSVVGFAKHGKQRIRGFLSGNVYPMHLLTHKGVKQWKHYEKKNGYDVKSDFRAQRKNVTDLIIMLRGGEINEKKFLQKMEKVHKLQHENYKRFLTIFPEYWNNLTKKQRKKYVKKIRKKKKYNE